MAAVYASGEVPMAGDVVLCINATSDNLVKLDEVRTVTKVDGNLVRVPTEHFTWRFKLIRRAEPSSPEPAPSSVGEWKLVKGSPPHELLDAIIWNKTFWIARKRDDYAHSYWPSSIEWHIPMTEIPPPPVEKVIELPRLFRATAICGKNVSVTGAVLEDGNYVWSGSGTEGKCKLDKVECFLTDVKFEA